MKVVRVLKSDKAYYNLTILYFTQRFMFVTPQAETTIVIKSENRSDKIRFQKV